MCGVSLLPSSQTSTFVMIPECRRNDFGSQASHFPVRRSHASWWKNDRPPGGNPVRSTTVPSCALCLSRWVIVRRTFAATEHWLVTVAPRPGAEPGIVGVPRARRTSARSWYQRISDIVMHPWTIGSGSCFLAEAGAHTSAAMAALRSKRLSIPELLVRYCSTLIFVRAGALPLPRQWEMVQRNNDSTDPANASYPPRRS